jgi:hypothetical protein
MSKPTFYRHSRDLEEFNYSAWEDREATLYRMNLKSPVVEMLIECEMQLSMLVAERAGGDNVAFPKGANPLSMRSSSLSQARANTFSPQFDYCRSHHAEVACCAADDHVVRVLG